MTALQEQLSQILKRSVALHGWTYETDKDGNVNQVPADKAVKESLKALCAMESDPKEQAKMIIAAWEDKTGALQRALNGLRIEQVGNYIAADSVFMSAFFEQVTLREDEEPAIYNDTKQQIRVSAMGEDGAPDQVRVVKSDAATRIGLYIVTSDWVKYKTFDLYKGRVDAAAKATFDIAFDLRFKLDRIHYDLLTTAAASGGAYGSFTVTGTKASRVYLPHTGIVTAHLPTTNDITNADVIAWDTTEGLQGFRPAVLAVIENYCASWANVLPGGGRLVPTGEVIVPASDIVNIAKELAPETGKSENQLQEQVNRDGYTSLHYLGRTWKFIGDVTIPKGTCFPRTNLMCGRTYSKRLPNGMEEAVETNVAENWERRRQARAYGCYIIDQYRPRVLRITYNNA